MGEGPHSDSAGGARWRRLYRHSPVVRVTHWINFPVLVILLGSGLQIFNAHPSLYWGNRSDADRALLALGARRAPDGSLQGITQLLGREFDTTGWLGVSKGAHGRPEIRGFPTWATIPGPRWLAMGRRWHLFFAWLFVLNGLVYVGHSLAQGHLRRELLPARGELRGFGPTLRQHLHPRRLRADSARGYNLLQKLSYLSVIFLLAPLAILTGLTMSPWLDAAFPGLITLFDGRQSARTIHFLAALGLVLFFLIHITMVVVVGPVNHTRAMFTGRLRIREGE